MSWVRPDLAFPDSDDFVRRLPQFFCNASVALAIPIDLSLPILGVALGDVSAFRAAVPEASIDENSKLFKSKEEIRNAKHISGVQFPPTDGAVHQHGAKPPFGGSVATRTDGPHVPASCRVRDGRARQHGC